MNSTLEQRLNALELSFLEGPLSLKEAPQWFLMFCEQQGTGHATEGKEYTEADWTWFRDNEVKAMDTFRMLNEKRGNL